MSKVVFVLVVVVVATLVWYSYFSVRVILPIRRLTWHPRPPNTLHNSLACVLRSFLIIFIQSLSLWLFPKVEIITSDGVWLKVWAAFDIFAQVSCRSRHLVHFLRHHCWQRITILLHTGKKHIPDNTEWSTRTIRPSFPVPLDKQSMPKAHSYNFTLLYKSENDAELYSFCRLCHFYLKAVIFHFDCNVKLHSNGNSSNALK